MRKYNLQKNRGGVARVDGGKETTTKGGRGKDDMVEKGDETTMAMVEEEKIMVVMKQLNVVMLHVGSFVITDCDRGGGREWGK